MHNFVSLFGGKGERQGAFSNKLRAHLGLAVLVIGAAPWGGGHRPVCVVWGI